MSFVWPPSSAHLSYCVLPLLLDEVAPRQMAEVGEAMSIAQCSVERYIQVNARIRRRLL